jgi:predicted transcriptional regulator
VALSLNDLKKGKAGKSPASTPHVDRRMVRPWEDPIEVLPKQGTNGEQIGNKQASEQATNGEQIGNKRGTALNEKKGKQGTERVTSACVNRVQIENKQETKWPFEKLRGHEAQLLQLIFDECHQTGDLLSPPLTLDRIAAFLESRKDTAKTIVYRLTKKGLVRRENSAVGRGGYTRFRLEKELYQALLIRETGNKRRTNREQIDNKQGTQQGTERVTNPPSSSSKELDLNKLTNTEEPVVSILSPEWSQIDTTPISEIRFGRSQLVQLFQIQKLTVEQVQESIYAFAFDLEVNGKKKDINGPTLNYFMGILRKGPYAPPANYEAPDVRQLRLYLEAKKREQQTRLELETQLETVEYDSWVADLPLEERARLVPASDFAKPGSPGHNVQLKQYFRENVWPARREMISKGQELKP